MKEKDLFSMTQGLLTSKLVWCSLWPCHCSGLYEHSKAFIPFIPLRCGGCSWGMACGGWLIWGGFGAGEAPVGRLFGFKVLALGLKTSLKERLSACGMLCLPFISVAVCIALFSEQACPVRTHNRPEIVLKLTQYFCVCFIRNAFSHSAVLVLLCDKLLSVEIDGFMEVYLLPWATLCYMVPRCVSHVLALPYCTQY